MGKRGTVKERFIRYFARAERVDDCLIWPLSKDKRGGYGYIGISTDRCERAHVISYLIHKGAIPQGMLVRHTCDNPPCVNPDHLILGTIGDNNKDAQERRLSRSPPENRLLQIFLLERWGMTKAAIGRVVNIHESCVHRLLRGQTRPHLRARFEAILRQADF